MSSTNTNSQKGLMVVGVDGSRASIKALEWAAQSAERLGCSIEVISSWEPYIPSGELIGLGMAPGIAVPELDPEEIALSVMKTAIDEVFNDSPPPNLIYRTLMGDAGRILIQESEGANMLVLGSRGRGKLKGLVLGSVSTTCAARAKCPVLIVHSDE